MLLHSSVNSQSVVLTPVDTNSKHEIEYIEFDNPKGSGLVEFNQGTIGVFGILKQKKILVYLDQIPKHEIRNNFDGVYDVATKAIIIHVYNCYSNILIPDTNINLRMKNGEVVFIENKLSFNCLDSTITVQSKGYESLEVKLPIQNRKNDLQLIVVYLRPKINAVDNNKIVFKFDKKTGIATNKGVKYRVKLE